MTIGKERNLNLLNGKHFIAMCVSDTTLAWDYCCSFKRKNSTVYSIGSTSVSHCIQERSFMRDVGDRFARTVSQIITELKSLMQKLIAHCFTINENVFVRTNDCQ